MQCLKSKVYNALKLAQKWCGRVKQAPRAERIAVSLEYARFSRSALPDNCNKTSAFA